MADTPAATAEPQPGTGAPDPDLVKQVEERRARREAADAEREAAGPRSGADLIKAAARGDDLTEPEAQDALDWFFAQEGEAEVEPKTLRLNVGTSDRKQWILWTVGPLDDKLISKIRKQAQTGSRAARRRGEGDVDEVVVAQKMVAAGTTEPNIRELAKRLGLVDPADAVHAFFKKAGKTGLIIQISGEILSLSGYDEDDVSEVDAASG